MWTVAGGRFGHQRMWRRRRRRCDSGTMESDGIVWTLGSGRLWRSDSASRARATGLRMCVFTTWATLVHHGLLVWLPERHQLSEFSMISSYLFRRRPLRTAFRAQDVTGFVTTLVVTRGAKATIPVPARRRAATELRRCSGRIRRTGTCGTGMGSCASSRPRLNAIEMSCHPSLSIIPSHCYASSMRVPARSRFAAGLASRCRRSATY